MNDRLLSFLGLCKCAGFLISGADAVSKAIRESKALLVLQASDLSANSAGDTAFIASQHGVPIRRLQADKDELSYALGKYCGVICITDRGFSDKILSMLDEDSH